jgi:hypothetical protein
VASFQFPAKKEDVLEAGDWRLEADSGSSLVRRSFRILLLLRGCSPGDRDTGRSAPSASRNAECRMPNAKCQMPKGRSADGLSCHSAFSIQHSAFGIQHSAFSIRHSAFGIFEPLPESRQRRIELPRNPRKLTRSERVLALRVRPVWPVPTRLRA